MDADPEGGLFSVACPECQSRVPISVPRSSEIRSITLDSGEPPGRSAETEPRRRRIRSTCPQDHLVSVVFDW